MAEPLQPPVTAGTARARAYVAVWKLHRVLGLGFAAMLVLMSVTGAVLVLHEDLERIVEPGHVAPPDSAANATPPPLADIARSVAPLAPPGAQLFRLEPADAPDATHKFIFRAARGDTRWSALVAPADGGVLWSGADQALFAPWLLELHMRLHSGRVGYVIVGLTGVGLVLLGLSGLYLHREPFAAMLRHPFRARLGWRAAFSDLHQWLGIAGLYFVCVLGLTGSIYVYRGLTAKRPPAPAAAEARFGPEKLAPLEPMLAAARARFPGAELRRIQFPAQAGAPLTVLLLHRDAPVWRKLSRIDFDPATGAMRTVRAAADAPTAEKFAAMVGPLHFGFYGAPWVRWTYFVGGLTPGALAVSGVLVWFFRSRRRTRDAARSRTSFSESRPVQTAAHHVLPSRRPPD